LVAGTLDGSRPHTAGAVVYRLHDCDYVALIAWLRMPSSTLMMVLLLVALFYHTALGLQVIIEDYVHSSVKFLALIIMRLSCFTVAAAGVLAILRVTLSG
jgi:succinate dehydrogenase / fumarate reductase, membrane anchor subunit